MFGQQGGPGGPGFAQGPADGQGGSQQSWRERMQNRMAEMDRDRREWRGYWRQRDLSNSQGWGAPDDGRPSFFGGDNGE
jgi:hypothetical protein